MYRLLITTLSILVISAGCNDNKSKHGSAKKEYISAELENLRKQNDVPGINLSIIYDDGEQQNFSAGFADTESKTALTPDHTMFSGSIGKTYAATIIYQLVDEGSIRLQDRFIDYFPDVTWLKRLPNIEDITIEMLLRHTSGLPRYVLKTAVWDSLAENPDKVWTYRDRLAMIFDDEPVHAAGENWAYSDTNYILLGMLIEEITGNYYYDEVRDRILIPQKLTATYAADKRELPNLASGYSRQPDSFRLPAKVVSNGKYAFNPQMEWTGGGIVCTTSDLARWAKIYLSGNLFPDSIYQKMISPTGPGLLIADSLSYGMGSFVYHTKHGDAYGHTGFMPGFVSIFAWYPDRKMAMALQINADYGKEKLSMTGYLDRIIDVMD